LGIRQAFYTELFRKYPALSQGERNQLLDLPLPYCKRFVEELIPLVRAPLCDDALLDEFIQFYIEKSELLKLCREAVAGMEVAHARDEIVKHAVEFLYKSCLIDPSLPSLEVVMDTYRENPILLRSYCMGLNECIQEARSADDWMAIFQQDQRYSSLWSKLPPKLYLGCTQTA
jgi:hypothetical protein